MINLKFYFSIIATCFSITMISAQDVNSKAESISSVNELLDKAIRDKKCIGVAAGVSLNGNAIWSNATGYEDAKSKTPLMKMPL